MLNNGKILQEGVIVCLNY